MTESRKSGFDWLGQPGLGIWVGLIVTGLTLWGVGRWVDLTPQVETDFFFSGDDPQLQTSLEIQRRFSSDPQIIVRATGADRDAPAYREMIERLTESLEDIDGVARVTSLATTSAAASALWSRVLLNPDRASSNVLVELGRSADRDRVVADVEATTTRFQAPDFALQTSGAPFVLTLIRRNLFRDLIVFSAGSLLVFGVAVAAVYRRLRVVLGTLAACLTACGLTLLATRAFGIGIGLLTANLATIVFVLTLSHIVFITSNWKHLLQKTGGEGLPGMIPDGGGHPVGAALRQTVPASFWCMVTTLLGFSSLLIATAKPLRELGLAGAMGTVISLVVAYSLYPVFLRNLRPHAEYFPGGEASWGRRFPDRHAGRWWVAVSVLGVVGGLGVLRLSTDPSLLSYFAAGSDLRIGLEAIDRDAGSSPLNLVVADSGGGRLDRDVVVERMMRLNNDLEADPAVGSLVSAPLVMEEAKRFPLLGRLSYRIILDIPIVGQLASGFIGEGRREALFVLRMRESERLDSRSEVIDRVTEITRRHGFDPVLLGGIYDLQGQLGRLIASSVRLGVGGLLLLFLVIGIGVSRSLRVGGAMVLSLTLVPLMALGSLGHAGVALDIISAPAASIAMAMGVDSMIHLSMRVRQLRSAGLGNSEAWREARTQLWHPIVGAALIICAGFGIFGLSSFPPTQRFGFLVILGTLTAAGMTLVMLPFAAARQSESPSATDGGLGSVGAAGSRHIAQDGGTP